MRRCLRRHPNYRNGHSRKTVKTQLGEVEIKELCDVEISPELVTKITEKIMPEVTAWQNRSLEAVYPFIFMDGIRFVKRFRILSERYRNRRKRFALRFSLVAGICNFDRLA